MARPVQVSIAPLGKGSSKVCTFHLSISSVSQGFSPLCVEGILACGGVNNWGCTAKKKVEDFELQRFQSDSAGQQVPVVQPGPKICNHMTFGHVVFYLHVTLKGKPVLRCLSISLFVIQRQYMDSGFALLSFAIQLSGANCLGFDLRASRGGLSFVAPY